MPFCISIRKTFAVFVRSTLVQVYYGLRDLSLLCTEPGLLFWAHIIFQPASDDQLNFALLTLISRLFIYGEGKNKQVEWGYTGSEQI